jgi:DNA-directed RNA polymerase beta subunit
MGPAFYQRLKHIVVDKMHTRMCGPLDTLTHQPLSGRAKDGGLRFGEMERDAILSHGSSRFLKECLFDKSDKYAVFVCPKCGKIPHLKDYCHTCDEEEIEMKNMPYATKLLFQELMGMGIKMRFT